MPAPICQPLVVNGSCTREQTLEGIARRHPAFTPFRKTSYSNLNYALLAWALEDILDGQPFEKILEDRLLKPLGLDRTLYSLPADATTVPDNSMMPFNVSFSGFLDDAGSDAAAGSIYSSTKDLDALGRSILGSTLLPRPLTNRWLKPLSLVEDPNQAVGMPFEIFRVAVPVSPGSDATRMVDLYTKAGDIGLYDTAVVIDPDHGMGFSVLVSGISSGRTRLNLIGMMRDIFLPAFEDLARIEAVKAFAGTYADPCTNSTIVIGTTADRPGLGVTSWISRGVDMLGGGLQQIYQDPADHKMEVRLQPTGLTDPATRRVSFRMVAEDRQPLVGTIWECFTWVMVDSFVYGDIGIDEFVFHLGEDGVATAIEPLAFRTKMAKAPAVEPAQKTRDTSGQWPIGSGQA